MPIEAMRRGATAVHERTLRFAIVGAGGYAADHIELIDLFGSELGCELAAVAIRPADRRGGQMADFEGKGTLVFDDAVGMFDELAGAIDAVIIPTAVHTHCELTCAAVERGHNVYLEKPPAAAVQEVDRMIRAVAHSGRICCLGFQAIFSEAIDLIKSRIVAGRLGEVRRLRCWAYWPRRDKYYARNEWAGRLRCGDEWVLDGPTNNALAHQIANMLYLASPVARAFAVPRRVRAELYHARQIDSEDTSAVEIEMDGGAVAYFAASHCTAGDHAGPWIEIECSAGKVSWHISGRTSISYADGGGESLERNSVRPELAALANFAQAVRAGEAGMVKCDLAMGRMFTLAANGAFESAGRTRAIPPEFCRRQGEGREARTVIEGIDEAIARCAAEGKLFSDIGCPWAEATEPFDLSDYVEFPQRFNPLAGAARGAGSD